MRLYLKDNKVLCDIEYAKGDSRRNDVFMTYAAVEGYFNGFYEKSLQLSTAGTVLDLYRRVCRMIERAEQVHSADKPIIIEEQVYEFRNLLKPLAKEIIRKEQEEKEQKANAWREMEEKDRTYRNATKEGCFGVCKNCVRNGYDDGYDCLALKKTLDIINKPTYDYKTGIYHVFNYVPIPDKACPLQNAFEEYDAFLQEKKKIKEEKERWII